MASSRGGAPDRSEAAAAAVTAVGTLATGIAHEINNPLAVVRTNVEEAVRVASDLLAVLPETAHDDVTELKIMLEETLVAAQRIEGIVRDLRPFASPEDRRTRVDLRAVIESAVSIAAPEIRHRARVTRELAPVTVLGSDVQLGQLFFNLVVNAAQAMPVGEIDRNALVVRSRGEGRQAIVEVADTGSGINDVDAAFAPLSSTRGRPGMGLVIARAVVVAHGGTIEVRANEPRGTIVRVTLPLGQ